MLPNAFAPLDLPSRRGLIPEYGGTSAWIDQFPFAYDFLAALRPGRIVEVGGAQIDAFLAFRQIARQSGFETRCDLVVHGESGAVGRVEARLAADLSGAPSRIFLPPGGSPSSFEAESIDLLEFDGQILAKALAAEWSAWLPRVRPGGWIFVHGCAPNVNGDPVAANFFASVTAGASDWFLFHHGAGLGAWRKPGGAALEPVWLAELATAKNHTTDLARHYEHAGRLARAWMPAARGVRGKASRQALATGSVTESERVDLLERAVAGHREREEIAVARLREEQDEAARWREAAKQNARQLASARDRARRAEARISQQQVEMRALAQRTEDALRARFGAAHAAEIERLNRALEAERGRVQSMQDSPSWRMTLPLRWASRQLGRGAKNQSAAGVAVPAADAGTPAAPASVSGLVRHCFDLPRRWERVVPGKLLVRGWCFAHDRPPMTEIRARSGEAVFLGRFTQPRPDVAAAWGLSNPAEPCGFEFEISVPPGHSPWNFDYRFPGEGEWHEFAQHWMRAIPSRFSRLPRRNRLDGTAQGAGSDAYARYIRRHDRLDDVARDHLAERVLALAEPPLLSVIMPTWESPVRYLQLAIESARRQIYPHWELCIADDASVRPQVRLALEQAAKSDARIRVDFRTVRGHISDSSNAAIAMARGSWLVLLDHDDELHPAALAAVALEIQRHPEAGLIYTDEDKIDLEGRRFGPYFKPDWNPDLLLGQNCISHLGCFRTDLVRELGGFRRGVEGCQDWDLALRVTDRLRDDQVRHIPRVLYHWRTVPGSTAGQSTDKSYILAAGRRILEDHFERIGVKGAELRPVPGWQWEVRFPLPEPPPRVSILMPTRDRTDLARRCVASVLAKTDYPDFELVIIDNGSVEPATHAWFAELAADPRVRILRYEAPFNYAAMHNWAVPQTTGQVLCLLNNDLSDLECITPGWLRDMTALALRPQTGAVGALLLYPDDTVQHAGVILGIDGCAGHAFRRFRRGTDGQMGRLRILQNYSAVTGACLVVRRALWDEVGGMDAERLGVAFNDVDFCLRLRERGYRNTWTPTAEFTHHESSSRGFEDTPEKQARFDRERAFFQTRWKEALAADPSYNPNLTTATESFDIADEPRIVPWREY